MKAQAKPLWISLILYSVLALPQLASAQSVWNAIVGTSVNTNWSTSANWTPNGAPGSSSTVIFDDSSGVANTTIINNVVDGSFGGTIAALVYTNVTTVQNTLIGSGLTLNVTGAGGLQFPNTPSSLSGAGTHTVTISGAGATLNINNSSAIIRVGWTNTAGGDSSVLNMSNLDRFTFTGSRIFLGAGATRVNGTLYLAKTNSITVSGSSPQIDIGEATSNNGSTPGGNLYLGQTNTVLADSIVVGRAKQSSASMRFNPALTNASPSLGPVVYFRGHDGASPIATWAIGDGNNVSGTSTSPVGTVDLSGGVVNAVITSMWLGKPSQTSATAPTGRGTLAFNAGYITVGNLTNGTALPPTSGGPCTATGIISVGGSGTLIVTNNLLMALFDAGDTASTGTLNIVDGSVLANSISSGGGTSIINMTNGTLIITNTLGATGTPVSTLAVTNSILKLSVPNSDVAATVSTLNLGGSTNIISIGSIDANILTYPTTFQIIKYSVGNGTNAVEFNIGLGTLPVGGYSGFISNDVANSSVDLVVTGGPAPPRSLVWKGLNPDAGNALTSVWDINTTRDWLSNSTAVAYNDNGGLGGDIVTLNDNGATNLVTLTATVSPTGIIVSNNILNYTIKDNSPGYALAGDGTLNKTGSGTLVLDNAGGATLSGGVTLDQGTLQIGNGDGNGGLGTGPVTDNSKLVFKRNDSSLAIANPISGSGSIADNNGTGVLTLSAANTFTGAVTVATGGVLQIGNNGALGTIDGGTIISNGAALDVFGHNIGQEPVIVSGTGPDPSKGAIYNSGTNVLPAIARLTLAGDTYIGGPVPAGNNQGRWDLRSASINDANGASLTVLTPGTKLTKVGANTIAITGVTVDPTLGDIDIQGGILSIEAATTGVGDPNATLTVENGATLSIYNATNQFNKNIVLNGNGINNNLGTLDNASGNNTVVGPMTFNGNVEITFLSSAGTGVGGSLTLSNTITGTGTLTKENTNTLIIAGTDSRNAATTINLGTFILNGIHANSNILYTVDATSILGGNGTNVGTVYADGPLHPGAGGKPSTFGAGSLNVGFYNNPPTIFDLSSNTTAGNGVNDMLNIAGDLEANGNVVYIHPLTPLNTNGTYTLARSVSRGSDFGSAQIDPAFGATRYQFSLDQSSATQVLLKVTGSPALVEWNNAANNGLWDVGSSQNWSNLVTAAAADKFYTFDSVLLDDTILNSANPTTVLTIPGGTALLPVVITNNSSTNYTIVGAGKISGSAGIVKLGTSTLTLATSNDFTGNVTILAGAVAVTNNLSLGATTGTVFVTNGASLDLSVATTNNGLNFGQKPFIVSGSGIGGNGAIINNGTNQQNVFQNVTMAGDTAFGGSARWDIRSPTSTNASATLSTGGHAYKLTKVGTNFIALSSVNVDPALGNIDVTAGTLSAETQITSLGNPASALTVFTNAALELWNNTNVLNKSVTLNDGSALINGSGNNTFGGPVSLVGTTTFNIGGLGLTLTNTVSGNGSLVKTGAQTLIFTVPATYTGSTLIVTGAVALADNGAITASSNIVISGNARLDASGRPDGLLILNSGQTLSGSGTVNGSLSNAVGSILSPGSSVGRITITNNAYLKGTTFMELDKGNGTNDILVVGNNIVYGGTLSLTNLSGTLTASDQFKLFSAGTFGTYSGAFSSIVPATPPGTTGLGWDTNSLSINGVLKIKVTTVSVPKITGISLSGTTLSLSATNGSAGGTWTLLQSTNVALPLSQWETNRMGLFDGSGNLSTNILNTATNVREFYLLKN